MALTLLTSPVALFEEALSLTDADAIKKVLATVSRPILESEGLLRLLFRSPLPQAPLYVDAILERLNVHVNFLYRDPLRILILEIINAVMPHCNTLPLRLRTGGSDYNRYSNSSHDLALVEAAAATSTVLFLETWAAQTPRTVLYTPTAFTAGIPPPDLSFGRERVLDEDALLSGGAEFEQLCMNGHFHFDLLLKYGLWQERLEYLSESDAAGYLAPLLQAVTTTSDARVRNYLLYFATQLVTLGLSPYTNIIFTTLHDLIRQGSNKTLADALEPVSNADVITDLITALSAVGFDINYQYMPTLIFAAEYGIVVAETREGLRLETVKYTGVNIFTLCLIYNRPDLLTWLFHCYGALPFPEAEAIVDEPAFGARTLDITVPVTRIEEDELASDGKFLTFVVNLQREATSTDQCELLGSTPEEDEGDVTPQELVLHHRATECATVLRRYEDHLAANWVQLDPLLHDMRLVGY